MKAFLVERNSTGWYQDYAMVVVAEDEERAKKRARSISGDFYRDKNITVDEINMNEEQCVLVANLGG